MAGGALGEKKTFFLYSFSIAIVPLLTPFIVSHIHQKNYVFAISILIFIFVLVTDAIFLLLKKKVPFSNPFIFSAMAVPIIFAAHYLGLPGALWSFPALISVYCLTPLLLARIYGVILLIGVTIALSQQTDYLTWFRYVASFSCGHVFLDAIIRTIVSLQNQLLEQVTIDPLTGIFNRRKMDICLQDSINNYKQKKLHASILILDIDNFKSINDNYGHDIGDIVISSFASSIKSVIRENDYVFRMGGDEFLVLLLNSNIDDSFNVAENIRKRISGVYLEKYPQTYTTSIGCSQLKYEYSAEQWIKTADQALYMAKSEGKNQVVSYPIL